MGTILRLGAVFRWIFTVLCVAYFWAFLIGKLFLGGIEDFSTHYTDWNWMMISIFFVMDLFTYIPNTSKLEHMLCIFFLWMTFGSAWLVFWLVFIPVAQNPNLILDLTTERGGKYSIGFVVNMHINFHVIPALLMLIYVMANSRKISKHFYRNYIEITLTGFVIVNLLALFSPAIYIGIYRALFNLDLIYGITMRDVYIALIAVAIIIVANGIPISLFAYIAAEKHKKKQKS